jgi:tRNA dimethylallyltransferase
MRIPVLTGATASGKSELIYRFLKERPDYELISADAFQVYKRLNIGTAKPDGHLLKSFPHHLINILEPAGAYSAGEFTEQAEKAVRLITERGKKPIVSGGTGLYIDSLRNGIFKEPPIDPEVREALSVLSPQELYAELLSADPESAAKINPNDKMRLARALEIWRSSGIPISSAHRLFKGEAKYLYNVFVLEKERERLYADINIRVENMLAAGWLGEVESLLDEGVTPDAPSFKAIGYRELASVLRKEISTDSARDLIAQKTRNFAKRQLTWFRRMKEVTFLEEDALFERLMREA